MTVSPNPAVVGQSFTVTATVIPLGPGTPSGNVTISIPGATPASANPTLVGGVASASFTSSTPGALTITAAYAGDTNFTGSTGFNTVVIIQGTTTTSVVSTPDPSGLGQNVAITATVTAVAPATGTPTGTVTFVVTGSGGGTFTQPLNGSGQATINLNTLGVGSHAITAIYNGDTKFLPSTGSDTQTVNPGPAATTTTVTSAPDPSVFGQSVLFTATVTTNPPATGTPTGSVVFTIDGPGGTTSPAVTLVGGVATFSFSGLGASATAHNVTAVYTPDTPNFITSTGTDTQLVNKANTKTSVTSSPNPSTSAQSITYIAFVGSVPPGSGTPTGSVTISVTNDTTSAVVVGPTDVPLDINGFAVLPSGALPTGSYTVHASYPATVNANFNASTSSETHIVT
ncbi:MAG: Ig-like domain repeat protein [Streptomyces sp.]|nr:Ig-like domain repeat protein [Streptomyces sp.]